MLAVLALMGVLAGLVFPLAEAAARRTKESELRISLRDIRTAIDAYKRDVDAGLIARGANESGYPRSLDDLVNGVPDRRSPTGTKRYYLRRLALDPMTKDDGAVHGLWALRSYASPPDDPKPGADVYDVRSQSTRVGLNGVPYDRW